MVAAAKRRSRSKTSADSTGILAEVGGVTISESDVDRAIREARERVGDEFAELLTARAMTEEEMDAIESENQAE